MPLRPLAIMLAALLLILAPAGCGSDAPEAPRQLRLVLWKSSHPQLWDELLAGFRAAHPDIPVALEVGPHSSSAFHDMLTQKLKNQSPEVDVFLMDVIWPPEFASAGWALPLDDYLTEGEREAFFPATLEANTYQDRLYGLPQFSACGMLYYRKDLLEAHGIEVPATWPALVAAARKIVSAEKAAGRDLVGYVGQFKQYEGLVCDMLEFIASAGGGLIGDGGCRLGEPAALTALDFVRRRIIGQIAPRGVLTYQEPESLAVMAQGRAVFLRNWPYAWARLNDANGSRVAGKVGVAPLPAFPGGRSAAALGGWQIGISRFSRAPDQAWLLASFLNSAASQRRLCLEGGRPPTRRGLYDDREILAANPHYPALREALEGATPRPRTPVYPALSRRMQVYFSTALAEPESDLEELAGAACREINQVLSLTEGAGGGDGGGG